MSVPNCGSYEKYMNRRNEQKVCLLLWPFEVSNFSFPLWRIILCAYVTSDLEVNLFTDFTVYLLVFRHESGTSTCTEWLKIKTSSGLKFLMEKTLFCFTFLLRNRNSFVGLGGLTVKESLIGGETT